MPAPRLLLVPVVATGLLLAACSGGAGGAPAPTAPSVKAAASAAPAAAAGTLDACALFPAAELKTAMQADPGTGVLTAGRTNGGTCTWKVSDTHTALAQLTREPDAYLPASIYPQKKTADPIEGVTRGWADASMHSILVVKNGKGVLFTDIAFQKADQHDYDALAAAVAARM